MHTYGRKTVTQLFVGPEGHDIIAAVHLIYGHSIDLLTFRWADCVELFGETDILRYIDSLNAADSSGTYYS